MGLRCLVVEDQLMLQQLLTRMLRTQPGIEVVGSAGGATTAIQACATLLPELLILDFALPDGDGLAVARALQELNPQARVIVLSSFASTVEWPLELRHQLVAIIDKTRAYQDLIAAITPLLPDQGPAGAESAATVDCSSLTSREWDVLKAIGRGLTSQAIAAELQISLRTVETHRRNISAKLGVAGAALVHQATLLSGTRHTLP